MAKSGAGERLSRALRTLLFMVAMLASLLLASAPLLLALADAAVSFALAAALYSGAGGITAQLRRYSFGSSLVDLPVLSLARSIFVTCVYSLCYSPGLYHGPYLGAATVCSLGSILFLAAKACVFAPVAPVYEEAPPAVGGAGRLHLEKPWAMPVLFLSSLVFALGHVVVAYRTSCRARRKLLFHRVDPEAVLACNVFSGNKVPRSPSPSNGKYPKTDDEMKRVIVRDDKDLPVSFLTDIDSLFLVCQGLTIHYKISLFESPPRSLASSPFHGSSPNASPRSISSRLKFERPLILPPKTQQHLNRSFSGQFQNSSLYAPLLAEYGKPPTYSPDEIPVLYLDDNSSDSSSNSLGFGAEDGGKVAVVLVHGFGGGVFSWRHVMSMLARQVGCPVVAFDRPGWGLTSRPRRKDWEDKHLPNPYNLESQVDLLISFCMELGFSSVVLVGHDDGGLLALKAAEKIRASANSYNIDIKGLVLLSVSLSREVVPAFARILLHMSLGKKHMVRPLLRTEITQVINRHAWFDPAKLTTEIHTLYKAPLYVEGWDEALHEIGRLSFATVLSPQNATALVKSVEDLPILVVGGAEDTLVPLKSAQIMASKLVNSRLVAISGCGHLPHEECPKALLAALAPFITRLLSPSDTLQKQ